MLQLFSSYEIKAVNFVLTWSTSTHHGGDRSESCVECTTMVQVDRGKIFVLLEFLAKERHVLLVTQQAFLHFPLAFPCAIVVCNDERFQL
jgi:hypothetical protein